MYSSWLVCHEPMAEKIINTGTSINVEFCSWVLVAIVITIANGEFQGNKKPWWQTSKDLR